MLFKNDNESIELNVLRRNNCDTEDYWDANWLQAEVKICLPGFNAHCGLMVAVDDFKPFLEQLVSLKTGASKSATFSTIEDEFYLELSTQPNGSLLCEGFVAAHANKLLFQLVADRTSLDSSVPRVETVVKRYASIET